MPATIGFAPMNMTNARGTFPIDTSGYIAGIAMDDPSSRNYLSGGILDATETLPMYGGVAIQEIVPLGLPNPIKSLGSDIKRATGPANMTGFSVFDQAHHMINVPGAGVPLAYPGMSVHFYRFGSNARIALACDPILNSLSGGLITQNLSWDFVNNRLIPYTAAYAANVFTASSYNAGTGLLTATTTSAHGLGVGQDVQLSGMTPSAYNGSYQTVAGTTGSTLVLAPLVPFSANPGAVTVQGQLNAGGGALPASVRVLHVDVGTSMVPTPDPVTGVMNWNYAGTCALVII